MNNQLIASLILIALVLIYIYYKQKQENVNSLYNRLGGIYPIAAVVDHFSDAVVNNPIAGKNSPNTLLRQWYAEKSASRLQGLKWMRTLWLCDVAGGPYKFIASSGAKKGKCPLSLENAHSDLKISADEFNAVAGELAKSLDHFGVPEKEKNEVLAAFAAHKSEIDEGVAKCYMW